MKPQYTLACASENSRASDENIAKGRRLAAHCVAYRRANTGRAAFQLITTAVPFFALATAMTLLVQHAFWATLLLAVPAAGLLVRLFIIQHDCGHGSFFSSRFANTVTGRLLSILTITPFAHWRRSHALHHASSGNLMRRGVGDIDTLSVSEYLALPALRKLQYRLYRNPFVLFLIGVPFYFLVIQRFPFGAPVSHNGGWRSIVVLNAAIAVVYGLLMAIIGVTTFLMAFVPVWILSASIGGWLFFIQHQFEDAYWDDETNWDFHLAAIHGSSYYALPPVLQWFTGNIGLHHIHHLCSRIPNYRLQECMDDCPELKHVSPRLTLSESLKCARLALWDADANKLVGFGNLKGHGPNGRSPVEPAALTRPDALDEKSARDSTLASP